jgi:resuscitation-promoting factor RpfB
VTLIVVSILVLGCGGLAVIGAIAGPQPKALVQQPSTARVASPLAAGKAARPATAPTPTITSEPPTTTPSASALATITSAAAQIPVPTQTAAPVVVTRTVTETQSIPFSTKRVNDSSLAAGSTKVRTHGVNGVKTLTYQVTLTNGVQTAKKLKNQQTTKAPVTQIIAVGTKHVAQCDPNYSGACVPIASDVDCAGGGGNGPAYVQGPVKVIGVDIYDLDRDGDGIGCD